jgi:hypothetical protein
MCSFSLRPFAQNHGPFRIRILRIFERARGDSKEQLLPQRGRACQASAWLGELDTMLSNLHGFHFHVKTAFTSKIDNMLPNA